MARGRFDGRVDAVAGELTTPGLGLSERRRDELASEVTTIVHSAASVSFSMELEEARAVNVEGTRRMLEFAALAQARGGLRRYAQVSTAYVAGTHDGNFSESDLDVGQEFRNSYEQSKFEAEQLVRTQGGDLPWMILRPSIVVGDRRSGWTAAFNVLYWPLRAFSTGCSRPFRPTPPRRSTWSRSTTSPTRSTSFARVRSAPHETFHLTAGAKASTMGELAMLASSYFRLPLPQVVPPSEFAAIAGIPLGRRARVEPRVLPVLRDWRRVRQREDERQAAARRNSGIAAGDYLERLLDFATASRWGKRPIARAEALAAWLAGRARSRMRPTPGPGLDARCSPTSRVSVTDDPDELVEVAFACPFCLRVAGIEWRRDAGRLLTRPWSVPARRADAALARLPDA